MGPLATANELPCVFSALLGSDVIPVITRLDPQARVAPEGREAARRFVHIDINFV